VARVTIGLRHPAAGSQAPVYVYHDQRSIPMERRRCRSEHCTTWLSAYNAQPICSSCEDKRARFLMANPLKVKRIPREDYDAAVREREQRAWEMHQKGETWVQISRELGYSTRDTARRAAQRHGACR
jgi:hypothetical protein